MVSILRPFSSIFASKNRKFCFLLNSVKNPQKCVVKIIPKNQKMTPKNTVFGEKAIQKTSKFWPYFWLYFSNPFHLFNKNLYKFI